MTAAVLERKLARLRQELEFLNAHSGVRREDWISDAVLSRAVERSLQTVIEACLDLGRRLVLEHRWGEPATGREVADVLAAHGVLTGVQADFFRRMVGLRNVLVHEYESVEPLLVWTVLTRHVAALRDLGQALARSLSPG